MPLTCMVYETTADLASAAAELIAAGINSSIEETGGCLVAVAGGSTPAPIYRELSRADIDWSTVVFVQTDERVATQATDRCAGAIETALGLTDPGRRACWYPIRVHGDAQRTAAAYDEQLARLRAEGVPDIAVLGLGTDGHTASIFDPTLGEGPDQRVVATTYRGEPRVSLGLNYLRAVPTRILLATGAGKSAALAQILTPAPDVALTSAALVVGEDGYVLADTATYPGRARA
ncbi:6-phosphogluconolactonase [Nocardia sp. NPDC058176]|uniref:6-phosphogluconolactonase n=1 Tax=Nocardia sp. NPDC058176 TaxID=3346368 RepID=UPI0036D8969D